jgi:hypothetical protein
MGAGLRWVTEALKKLRGKRKKLRGKSCCCLGSGDDAGLTWNHEELNSKGRPCYCLLWKDLSCEGFGGIERRKSSTDELLVAQDGSDGGQKLT